MRRTVAAAVVFACAFELFVADKAFGAELDIPEKFAIGMIGLLAVVVGFTQSRKRN